MLPMNYAILKLFEDGQEFDANQVMGELDSLYGSFRAFKKANIIESLMAAEKNDLLQISRLTLEDNDELCIYYRATEYGADMIKRYI